MWRIRQYFLSKRRFFIIARIVALFFVGLVVAVIIALSQIDLESLRGDLIRILQNSTGYQVEIDGNISWKFSLRPRVELNDIRIPNAPWATEKNGFAAKKINLTLNLLSLLRKTPTIQSVSLSDVVLNVEQNSSGEYSFVHADVPGKPVAVDTGNKTSKFPFNTDMGFMSVDTNNIAINISGDKYFIDGLSVNHKSNDDTQEFSGWIKYTDTVYPFIISFGEYNDERRIYPVRIAASADSSPIVANIALEGSGLIPIDWTLRGDIPDISGLVKIFGIDIPKFPEININAAGGISENKIIIRKTDISIAGNNATMSGDIDLSDKLTTNVKLQSDKINMMQALPFIYTPGSAWVHPNRPLNVFRNTPLYGEIAHDLNFNLELDIGELIMYRELSASDLKLTAKLHDDIIRVDMTTKMGGGNLHAGIDANVDENNVVSAAVAGIGENISAEQILQQLRNNNAVSGLPINFKVYLTAHGRDLTELMSTVSGPVLVYSSGYGYANSDLVGYMYGTDFLTDLRHNIQDLFTREKNYERIGVSCAVGNIKLRNGVVETKDGVALESAAVNMRMAGGIDLGAENLKVSLITTPVRGLKLSLTGNIVNVFEFSGNMAEPDMKISGDAIAGKLISATGIGLLLAPFTGGLSIVAGAGVGLLAGDFIENWLADAHPCKTAIESGASAHRGDPDWLNKPVDELINDVIKEK